MLPPSSIFFTLLHARLSRSPSASEAPATTIFEAGDKDCPPPSPQPTRSLTPSLEYPSMSGVLNETDGRGESNCRS
jgi:hypothetical protein